VRWGLARLRVALLDLAMRFPGDIKDLAISSGFHAASSRPTEGGSSHARPGAEVANTTIQISRRASILGHNLLGILQLSLDELNEA